MTDANPTPLPPREPRAWWIHWAVDTAIAFLAIVIVALIWGVPIWAVILAAVAIGLIATRYTQRAELRGLAQRNRDEN